jgi:hypothetical protein
MLASFLAPAHLFGRAIEKPMLLITKLTHGSSMTALQ